MPPARDRSIRTFGVVEIRALTRDGERAALDRKPGKGWGYPEQAWLYRSAGDFYVEGRDPAALWRRFAVESGGIEPDEWQRLRRAELTPRLETFLRMDATASGIFLKTAFTKPTRVEVWHGHRIRLPFGLTFATQRGKTMRLLWPERDHGPRSRGINLLATATFAIADDSNYDLAAIEAWHLRGGEISVFDARDLRRNYSQLDRLLTATERPAGEPPAA
jgi:hypothetical protein